MNAGKVGLFFLSVVLKTITGSRSCCVFAVAEEIGFGWRVCNVNGGEVRWLGGDGMGRMY